MNLLQFPFDQYGRYRMVQEALDAAADTLGHPSFEVLDVGGYFQEHDGTPRLPAQQFLPRHTVTVLDRPECPLPGYVQGDGNALQFPDGSFDFVITCDTLEHIPPDDRPRFCGELLRVARLGVALICPIDDPRVVLAERILAAYIRAELDREQPQLVEHSAYGLPKLPLVRQIFADAGCGLRDYPSGDVYAWLPMMLAKHFLGSRADDPILRTGLDELYNASYALQDRRAPSYRSMVVAAKDDAASWLEAVDQVLLPTIRQGDDSDEGSWVGLSVQLLGLLQLGMSERQDSRRNSELRQQLDAYRVHISHQDRQIADHIEQIRGHVDHIGSLFARIELQEDALLWRQGQIDELHQRARWLEAQANDVRAQLAAVQNGFVLRLLRRVTG